MIERTLGYKVGQMFFPCIEEAQKHELEELLKADGVSEETSKLLAHQILKHQEKIMDILTTTPTSKVRGRKINGGTKRRKKASPEATSPILSAALRELRKPGPEAVNAALQDMDQ